MFLNDFTSLVNLCYLKDESYNVQGVHIITRGIYRVHLGSGWHTGRQTNGMLGETLDKLHP